MMRYMTTSVREIAASMMVQKKIQYLLSITHRNLPGIAMINNMIFNTSISEEHVFHNFKKPQLDNRETITVETKEKNSKIEIEMKEIWS